MAVSALLYGTVGCVIPGSGGAHCDAIRLHVVAEMSTQASAMRATCDPASQRGAARAPSSYVRQMSVDHLAMLLTHHEACSSAQLIDVREEGEARLAKLPQFQLLPMSR